MEKLYRIYFDKEEKQFVLDKEVYDYTHIQHLIIDYNFESYYSDLTSAEQDIRKRNEDIAKGYLKNCIDCKKYFWMLPDEKEWFEVRGLYVPKRCPVCRGKKKKM